ncbi:MAG: M23 family metallopeptidase [Nitrospiria bacterium]
MTIILSFVLLFLSFPGNLQGEEVESPIQVEQGDFVYLSIRLDRGTDSIQGTFLGQPIPFFKTDHGGYTAMIGVDLAQSPGPQPFVVTWKEGETVGRQRVTIEVVSASFGVQRLTLPKKMVDLDPATLIRVKKEQKRLKGAFGKSTGERLWRETFVVPAEGKKQGTFGRRRFLNGKPRNPHTGEDISAPEGTSVLATNSGKVVLVGDFFFNGRSVVIDHGLGLFSMYFHLLDATVEEGATVNRGERIGRVGQSGRATGPHLHWGMRLNGARIDPFSLIEKKLN